VVKDSYNIAVPFDEILRNTGISLGRELNTTDDAELCTPVSTLLSPDHDPRLPQHLERLNSSGYLLLHEGRTFHQYTDRWENPPKYAVHVSRLAHKLHLINNARYFKLVYRTIAASTNERTGIFSIHVPGVITQDKNPTEKTPGSRPNSVMLQILAVTNSYTFDFLLRQYVSSATVNYFFLARVGYPPLSHIVALSAAHNALRLICNHGGYKPLWQDQVGDAWREPKPPFTWPVLEGDDERWLIRAAIDAIVADAYGLSRDQYAYILSSFTHRSYPKAPELCLDRFGELNVIGLEAFTKRYDPYWDIPLNENLPTPVIDIPTGEDAENKDAPEFSLALKNPDVKPQGQIMRQRGGRRR
jgi:hypothetical protein